MDRMDRMDFKTFTDEVRDNIGDYLLQYDIDEISVNKVTKNNGLVLTGITIREEGKNIAPNIYLDGYYQQYLAGESMHDIYSDIAGVYRDSAVMSSNYSANITEYDSSRLFIKLVGIEENREYLENVVYEPFQDMAATVRCISSMDEHGIASYAVTQEVLMSWGVNRSEVIEAAKANTTELFPPRIVDMNVMLKEMTGADMPEFPDGERVYVITNSTGINGAASILNPEVLETASKRLGGDLLILPSSIHECIALRDNDLDADFFAEMVREVNSQVVQREEKLTDSVYRYDAEEKKLSIASERERDNEDYLDR